MKRIIIIGASGHGKVVADIAQKVGYTDIVFLDDNLSVKSCGGYPVIGKVSSASELAGDMFVAIGDTRIRKRMMEQYKEKTYPILIHPNAVLGKNVEIGAGTVIMAGVVINADVRIGKGCIINTSSSIDHDSRIGDYCHISVGSHICGTVAVGEQAWIGAGGIISNNISICEKCTVGAGAVIIQDINIPGTYVGVPARRIK